MVEMVHHLNLRKVVMKNLMLDPVVLLTRAVASNSREPCDARYKRRWSLFSACCRLLHQVVRLKDRDGE